MMYDTHESKTQYIGLLAVLPVFVTVMTSNSVSASALEQGSGANRHTTALYDPFLVCGDHLGSPAEKKAREHGLGLLVEKVNIAIQSRWEQGSSERKDLRF